MSVMTGGIVRKEVFKYSFCGDANWSCLNTYIQWDDSLSNPADFLIEHIPGQTGGPNTKFVAIWFVDNNSQLLYEQAATGDYALRASIELLEITEGVPLPGIGGVESCYLKDGYGFEHKWPPCYMIATSPGSFGSWNGNIWTFQKSGAFPTRGDTLRISKRHFGIVVEVQPRVARYRFRVNKVEAKNPKTGEYIELYPHPQHEIGLATKNGFTFSHGFTFQNTGSGRIDTDSATINSSTYSGIYRAKIVQIIDDHFGGQHIATAYGAEMTKPAMSIASVASEPWWPEGQVSWQVYAQTKNADGTWSNAAIWQSGRWV